MRQSGNVEDRRGAPGGGFRMSPMGLGGGFRGGGLGLGGLLVVLVLGWIMGINPLQLLSGGGAPIDPGPSTSAPGAQPTDQAGDMMNRDLGDTEDFWNQQFRAAGASYPAPVLVLFSEAVSSACGTASSAVGPFYCPRDRKVYLDTNFFNELDRRFGAPGDFAQAYVVAHEVGHHIQNVLGLLGQNPGVSRSEANQQSVQQELQADCLAGMWGRSAAQRNKLELGDVEEGLTAAAAIGDDRIQKQTQGRVVPESFTHGSSAQRVAAFRQGLESADMRGCGVR
jgi:predicted metalloprotease